MPQTTFEVLDQMNKMDIENNTKLVSVSPHIISANRVKKGSHITMGADHAVFDDILSETHMAILVVVEKKTFFELSK